MAIQSKSKPARSKQVTTSKQAKSKRAPDRRRTRSREPSWVNLSDEELLQKRFCDLRLSLRHTVIDQHIRRIRRDLKRRGIGFAPHVWLSEEWFSPDGVPGIAIALYMAHPRLMRLERKMMDEVEGGNANWLTRIMRHEFAHALDNAYRLRRRKEWRETFGDADRPYPNVYRPRPASRDFVLHLGHWYAQSHPTEDWAETFAVWMQPKARWRRDYQRWPALQKLEYVDRLMADLSGVLPHVMRRRWPSTIVASAPTTISIRPMLMTCGSSASLANIARSAGACVRARSCVRSGRKWNVG
jgi:hypothetical protein